MMMMMMMMMMVTDIHSKDEDEGRYLHRFEADRHCPLSQSHTWILVYVSDGGHKFCLMLMILHVQIREELGDLLDHVKQGGRGRSPTCLVTLLTLSGSLSMSRRGFNILVL